MIIRVKCVNKFSHLLPKNDLKNIDEKIHVDTVVSEKVFPKKRKADATISKGMMGIALFS